MTSDKSEECRQKRAPLRPRTDGDHAQEFADLETEKRGPECQGDQSPQIGPEIAARIEGWVREQFSVSPTDLRFGQDVDLFDNGYVDSVGLAELIGFLEEELGVEIPDELLVADEFTTIAGISHAALALGASEAGNHQNGKVG